MEGVVTGLQAGQDIQMTQTKVDKGIQDKAGKGTRAERGAQTTKEAREDRDTKAMTSRTLMKVELGIQMKADSGTLKKELERTLITVD